MLMYRIVAETSDRNSQSINTQIPAGHDAVDNVGRRPGKVHLLPVRSQWRLHVSLRQHIEGKRQRRSQKIADRLAWPI